jgi:hypothetical protein
MPFEGRRIPPNLGVFILANNKTQTDPGFPAHPQLLQLHIQSFTVPYHRETNHAALLQMHRIFQMIVICSIGPHVDMPIVTVGFDARLIAS